MWDGKMSMLQWDMTQSSKISVHPYSWGIWHKFHLNYYSQYVIYLIECVRGVQYAGRIVQKLHQRLNMHRNNIKKYFLLQSVSRHMSTNHPEMLNSYSVMPIDHITSSVPNRFEALKKREIYWIYKLDTLKPHGLNEITEMIY